MTVTKIERIESEVVPGWTIRRAEGAMAFVDPDGTRIGLLRQENFRSRSSWSSFLPTLPSTIELPDGHVRIPAERRAFHRDGKDIAFIVRDRRYVVRHVTGRCSEIDRQDRTIAALTRRPAWVGLLAPGRPRVTAQTAGALDATDALVVVFVEFCLGAGRPGAVAGILDLLP